MKKRRGLLDMSILKQIDSAVWEIAPSYKKGMRVPARLIATPKLLKNLDSGVVEQVTNLAFLPGVVNYTLAMPDAHWGYGAPIGGVFATDPESGGVISPGAIGFDINCGMRLLRTNLTIEDVQPRVQQLVETLFNIIPTGVGSHGALQKLSHRDFRKVAKGGTQWCINHGYGWPEDRAHTEEHGQLPNADPDKVSQRAVERGLHQLGTLGSGNHYLEIQVVEKENIIDTALAKKFGLFPGQITIMIHCGSRGFGHQIATDYIRAFGKKMREYKISTPDKQLACAPFHSADGQDYYAAMACAVNVAFANRQVIMHLTRKAFSDTFRADPKNDLGMDLVYDVAHNIAKLEKQPQNGKMLLVHRKGATRSFGPHHQQIPEAYQSVGQPVIIGGSMESGSYLLVGTKQAEETTFGSTAHGSGRIMSRAQARKEIRGQKIKETMRQKGIYVKTASMSGLAEEAGIAYKDISEVVEALTLANISRPVVSFKPLGNIKG